MLKIKRIFSIVLATLVLFLVSPFVVVAQADDKTTDLYILSKQCPQEYVDYMTAESGAHAIVALGYENVRATVTVWNPWYTYFETVTTLNAYTPSGSTGSYSVAEYWYNNYC